MRASARKRVLFMARNLVRQRVTALSHRARPERRIHPREPPPFP